MKNNDRSKLLNTIRAEFQNSRSFVITSHINPDGDAIGSVLGLYHLLKDEVASDVTFSLLLPSRCPDNLQWLPGASALQVWENSTEQKNLVRNADCIVVLDLNTLERLHTLGEEIRGSSAKIINIDHHVQPETFAHLQLIDTDAAATCQMVAELFSFDEGTPSGIQKSSEGSEHRMSAAQCLYTGIMTDSGGFRFPRTTPALLRLAANLVECGADPVKAYDLTNNTHQPAAISLLGNALRSMKLFYDGRVCFMVVTADDLKQTGCTVEATDGLVQHTLSIQGVRIGVLFVELPDQIKCSLRSKQNVFIRDVAASMGGGGHNYAAGVRVPGVPLETVIGIMHQKLGELLNAVPGEE